MPKLVGPTPAPAFGPLWFGGPGLKELQEMASGQGVSTGGSRRSVTS